jgi:uncharacterized protein (TIGR02246 family)
MPAPSRKRPYAGLAAALLLAATLASCSGGPRPDAQREAQAIRDLEKKWNEAIAAKDSVATAGYYAEDGMVIVAFRPPVTGRKAIESWWSALLRVPGSSLTFSPTTVEVAQSGDVGYEVGAYQTVVATPQGRVTDNGSTFIAWKKVKGEWQVAVHTFSSSEPLFPTPPPPPSK